MSRTCAMPKFTHLCVFCEYWTGDADMKFRSTGMGYEFEREAIGQCIKKKGTKTKAASGCSNYYEPNREAKKLL